jgi:hypothetical protein
MSKDEFVSRFIKEQANRRKKRQQDIEAYQSDARWRMKRLYRGNLLRPSIRGRR